MKLCTVMGEGLENIIIYFWNLPAYYASVIGQGLGGCIMYLWNGQEPDPLCQCK
jgi:hypothetical protein